MRTPVVHGEPIRSRSGEPPSTRQQVDPAAAEEFLGLYHAECPDARPARLRVEQVRSEIDRCGTYTHTAAELAFGARAAWRNSSRCIGRLYWRSLRVRDRRHITAAEQVAAESFAHLREATNGGRVRPTLTVFAPTTPDRPGPRIWNEQLIRYAGYRRSDGTVLGDPRYVDFTNTVRELGWRVALGRRSTCCP
jgi:nitric-oxide synthase, bacterial